MLREVKNTLDPPGLRSPEAHDGEPERGRDHRGHLRHHVADCRDVAQRVLGHALEHDGVAREEDHELPGGGGNRRFWPLSALRAHTKAPYKTDLHRKTRRALNRSWAARTVGGHDTVDHRRAARRELRLDLCPVLELLLHRP